MIVEENILVMLLVEDRFEDFVNGAIADPEHDHGGDRGPFRRQPGGDRRAGCEGDRGGRRPGSRAIDEGPMYGGSFQDLDGHVLGARSYMEAQ